MWVRHKWTRTHSRRVYPYFLSLYTTTSAVGIFSPSGSPCPLHSRLFPLVDIIPGTICEWLAAP